MTVSGSAELGEPGHRHQPLQRPAQGSGLSSAAAQMPRAARCDPPRTHRAAGPRAGRAAISSGGSPRRPARWRSPRPSRSPRTASARVPPRRARAPRPGARRPCTAAARSTAVTRVGHRASALRPRCSAPARSAPSPPRSPATAAAPASASALGSIATNTTCAVWVCCRSPVLTFSEYTSTVMSIEVLPTKSTVAVAGHQGAHGNRLVEVEPVDDLRHRGPAGVPDRGDRGRLVHQRHQVAAEEIAQHVLHVRHHEV